MEIIRRPHALALSAVLIIFHLSTTWIAARDLKTVHFDQVGSHVSRLRLTTLDIGSDIGSAVDA
jgi:hypothetical protein